MRYTLTLPTESTEHREGCISIIDNEGLLKWCAWREDILRICACVMVLAVGVSIVRGGGSEKNQLEERRGE